MLEIDQLNSILDCHLKGNNTNDEKKKWRIQESSIEGRGIFANCDIKTGEIIFVDQALLIGPRAKAKVNLHCVVCSTIKKIKACSKGCGLPTCSTSCEETIIHKQECELIRNKSGDKKFNEISFDLFRSLTPLRSFFLPGNLQDLIRNYVCHRDKKHGFEIDLIKQYLTLTESDETFLRTVCSVLDSNAFETIVIKDNNQSSLRGLYPLASLMNHCCVPNTTHLFDNNQQMIVKATVPITKDSEIFTTYTSLLWGTISRRHHLTSTKHFWCECVRCKDPKEFNAGLSGLKCILENCQGEIFPLDPLNNASKWKCQLCNSLFSHKKIGIIQSTLGSLLMTVNVTEAEHLIRLIKDRVENVVPKNNQIAVEMKLRLIWMLGHDAKYKWSDISLEQINFKEKLCKDILEVISNLQLGQCKIRGLVLYDLYRCQLERCLRKDGTQEIQNESREMLKEASEILRYDVTAPDGIINFVY